MTVDWTRRRDEALREETCEAVLPSGLRAVFLPKPGFRQKTAVLTVSYGSLDGWIPAEGGGEPRRAPAGLAHFLEHRLFESEEGDAAERLAALGATCNASTGHTNTSYFFSCVDRFFEGLDVLLGFLGGFRVSEAAVARERRIIAEEIGGTDDSPDWAVWQRLMACLYVESDARLDISGTRESIEAIDAGWLGEAYRAFYRPSNAVLAVAGDVDPGALLERAARCGGGVRPRLPRPVPAEPARVAFRRSVAAMEVSQPKVAIGFKEDPPAAGGEELVQRGAETAAGLAAVFGRASDFFRDQYGAGRIDDSFQFQHVLEPGLAHTVFQADTDDPDGLAGAVLERLDRARRAGADPEDVRRILKAARGRFLRALDHPEAAAFALAGHAQAGGGWLDIPGLQERVTPEGVSRRLADALDPAAHAVSIVLPAGRRAPRSAGGDP